MEFLFNPIASGGGGGGGLKARTLGFLRVTAKLRNRLLKLCDFQLIYVSHISVTK